MVIDNLLQPRTKLDKNGRKKSYSLLTTNLIYLRRERSRTVRRGPIKISRIPRDSVEGKFYDPSDRRVYAICRFNRTGSMSIWKTTTTAALSKQVPASCRSVSRNLCYCSCQVCRVGMFRRACFPIFSTGEPMLGKWHGEISCPLPIYRQIVVDSGRESFVVLWFCWGIW